MGKKVTESLAVKYDKVKKEVRSVMGGEVLELKTDKIIAREKRAEKRGANDKTRQVVENMLRRGNMSDSDICAIAECDMDLVNDVRAKMK